MKATGCKFFEFHPLVEEHFSSQVVLEHCAPCTSQDCECKWNSLSEINQGYFSNGIMCTKLSINDKNDGRTCFLRL